MVKFKLFFLVFISFAIAQTNLRLTNTQDFQQFQKISVTISGDFPVNGTYAASINERLDEFITRIFEAERQVLKASTQPNLANKLRYATRNIRLIRDGKTQTIDLHKYRMKGDLSNNPFLKDNDIIIFPRNDIDFNYISVEGAVNKPGKFLYVKGDKLKDAIELSLGFNEAFDKIDKILVYRSSSNTPITLTTQQLDFELKPADRIIVKADFDSKKDRRVLVIGEVKNPGYIPINTNNNNIKDILLAAGGLKETADTFNIELFKNSPLFYNYQSTVDLNLDQLYLNEYRIQEMRSIIELLELERMAYLYPEDTLGFHNDLKLRQQKNAYMVNYYEIKGDTIINSISDGDVIVVNKLPDNVYVFGHTNFVGNIKFSPNQDVYYYLNLADGIGDYARKNEIYLIRYKTKQWTNINDTKEKIIVERGDYIWIPKEARRDFNYYTQRIAAVAQIVSALTTTVIAVIAIFRK